MPRQASGTRDVVRFGILRHLRGRTCARSTQPVGRDHRRDDAVRARADRKTQCVPRGTGGGRLVGVGIRRPVLRASRGGNLVEGRCGNHLTIADRPAIHCGVTGASGSAECTPWWPASCASSKLPAPAHRIARVGAASATSASTAGLTAPAPDPAHPVGPRQDAFHHPRGPGRRGSSRGSRARLPAPASASARPAPSSPRRSWPGRSCRTGRTKTWSSRCVHGVARASVPTPPCCRAAPIGARRPPHGSRRGRAWRRTCRAGCRALLTRMSIGPSHDHAIVTIALHCVGHSVTEHRARRA